jgi:uncharacterized protein YhaN
MRVERLRVHGFGRLVDREFELAPGLTLVHGPNEAGKSTLHSALAASLVGLVPGGRRTPALAAVVERYRPWAGERYGTRLELRSAAGRRMRLDWDFARWTFTVTDAATGEDVTGAHGAGTDPETLCDALYGVSRDAYLRVGCIRQGELVAIGESAGVRQALERVAGQTGADDGATTAVDALHRQRRRLVGLNRARTNALPRAEEALAALEARLADAERERADAEAAAAERDALREQARALAAREHALEMGQAAARARVLRRRVERAASLDAERQAAVATIEREPPGVAGWRPVEGLTGARERVADLERRVRAGAGQREAVRAALDELERTDVGSAAAAVPAVGHARLAVAGAGALAALAGAAAGTVALVVAGLIVLAIGGALQAAVARRLREAHERAREADRRAEAARRAREADLRAEVAALEAVPRELALARQSLAQLLGVEPDPAAVEAALAAYDRTAAAYAGHTQAEHRQALAETELRSLLGDATLDELTTRLVEVEATLNGHRNAPGADRDPDDVGRELERVRRERERATLAGEAVAARVDERLRTLPDVAALTEQLGDARERVERLRRIDAVLRLAEAELAEAAAETYRDFAPRLNAALQTRLARVTQGRYATAFVGDDLTVRVEAPETGAPIDLDQTSVGTQKLAYLVQRLELVALIAPSAEPLPVLLDDPFAHLDRRRLSDALELLAELAGERQLIVFTTQQDAVDRVPPEASTLELVR